MSAVCPPSSPWRSLYRSTRRSTVSETPSVVWSYTPNTVFLGLREKVIFAVSNKVRRFPRARNLTSRAENRSSKGDLLVTKPVTTAIAVNGKKDEGNLSSSAVPPYIPADVKAANKALTADKLHEAILLSY